MARKQDTDILLAKTDTGTEICILCPFGKAGPGDLVKTSGGILARVTARFADLSGEIQTVAGRFTTVYRAVKVWGVYWEAGEVEEC